MMIEGWKNVIMDNLGEVISGGTPKTNTPEYWNGNISWVTPTDVTALKGMKYLTSTTRSISEEGLRNSSANLLPINTLIVCTRATIGDSAINKIPMSTNQGFKSLITKVEVSVEFMYYWMISNQRTLIKQSSGSTFLELSTKSFKSLNVLLPPLKEQKKISEILSTVDAKIEVIHQRISQTQNLKKGLMQSLLTKGVGHTEFKNSPLGEIPMSWEVVKLGEVCQTFAGGTPKRSNEAYYKNGTIPWVKSGEVDDSNINLTEEHVTELAIKESSTKLIKANSILIALYGATAGKVGILKIEACSNQAVLAVNTKSNITQNIFIYHFFKNITKKLLDLSQGSGQPNLSKKIIDNVVVPLPPVSEQTQISNILSMVDNKLVVLQDKKNNYQDLKKGLMQQLLTGKVRVTSLIKEAV
jgi:type I restriction enzyme S subunit